MEALEVLELIGKGETSSVQFKETIENKYASKLASEIAAFANAKGGIIIYGVNDKTLDIKGLQTNELGRIQSLVASVGKEHVTPFIYPETEVVTIDEKLVLLIHVQEGEYKPYMDKDGVIWTKSASDKRKVTSQDEISRLFQSGKRYYADKQPVHEALLSDLDLKKFGDYFEKVFGSHYTQFNTPLEQILENQNLYKGGHPTLAGMLLFGKKPEFKLPTFIVKCVRFKGNDIGGKEYLDSEDMKGTIDEQFKKTMSFLSRNIVKVQGEKDFNSEGSWEVSEDALKEIVQNALIHRDYFKNAPVRVFIFNDRIEIISPGKLPNSLTVENIRFGQSVPRNNAIISVATNILPYRGVGSGIRRALKDEPKMQLKNDVDGEQFIVRFPKP